MVCCGNGEARIRIGGRKWVKGSMMDGRERRERRKKIVKRGIECISLVGCDAVRWASSSSVWKGCIALASPRVVLGLLDPDECTTVLQVTCPVTQHHIPEDLDL